MKCGRQIIGGVIVAIVVAIGVVGEAVVRADRCWAPPVSGRVVDGFRPPPCPWCAGNRGIEYATADGSAVRSAEAGVVTFSGDVAGTQYVVVELANGWLLTYGRLASRRVVAGDPVLAGTRLGSTSHEFFFGLRVRGEYRDPAPWIGRWIGRPRLVPVDGRSPRPSSTRRLSCAPSAEPSAPFVAPLGGSAGTRR